MRQAAPADRVGARAWAVRAALAVPALLAAVHTVSTVPGVRSGTGFDLVLDGWLQSATYLLLAVVAGLQPVLRRGLPPAERLLWSLVAVSLALRTAAFVYYIVEVREAVPQPYPSPADALWVAGSLTLLAALGVLVRIHAPRLTVLVVLDAVIAALTAAAVASLLLYDTLAARLSPGQPRDVVLVSLAYPVLDVALLTMAAAYVTLVQWRPAREIVVLVAGLVGFAVIDAVFVQQITAGTFRPATLLTGLNVVSTALIAYAGWLAPRARTAPPPPGRGGWFERSGIAVAAVGAFVSLGCLLVESAADTRLAAMVLPSAALVLALVRGLLTLSRDRSHAGSALVAQNEELLRFQALVDASVDFIAMATLDGDVFYVNPAGRALVGIPTDRPTDDLRLDDFLTEEGLRAFREVRIPAVRSTGHWEGESELRNLRGGAPIPVTTSTFLVRHPGTGAPLALATLQRDITPLKAAERELQQLADQRQELLGRLVQAQEDERDRIAADVHDDSVQALAAVELRLGLLRRRLAERAPDLVAGLDEMSVTVSSATGRLRHLLFDLDAPALRDDLAGALEQAASYVFEDGPVWELVGDRGIDLPESLRVTAYRIAKEAMVNAGKHAGAGLVTLELRRADGGVEVIVRDDGRGLGPGDLRSHPGHHGVTAMRDRAAVAGGRLDIEGSPDEGTLVRLWLPDTGAGPGVPERGDVAEVPGPVASS